MGALQLCISIFTWLVYVIGALALGRTIYVFCKETVARQVDSCLHLPLFFLTILQYTIFMIILIKNPDHFTDNDDMCALWGSVGGNVLQFIVVFIRASFIPCVLITIYMPYLALKRSEFLDGISHLDTLKCAGVIGVYSTIVGICSCSFYGLHPWAGTFCFIHPKVVLTIDILSFCIAFACGPYFWFYGLKEYFKLSALTDDERTVAFGEVMDTLRMIMEKENQLLTNAEIDLPGVTSSPLESEMNLSPSLAWSYGGSSSPGPDSPSPPPMPEPERHDSITLRFNSITEPDRPDQKRMKYVSDLDPPSANLTKPKLHRVITADSPGHVMLKKSGQAVRKSLLSAFDLKKRRKLKSMHRMHSIYIYGKLTLLDQEETESIAKERDLEHITPDVIRVVTALNKKLFRCATFLGFMFLASVIFTILELSMNGMPGILADVSVLIWSFAPLLVCNIVFEAPSLKREGIRLIPFNDKLREYICKSCFSNSPKSTVEITVVPCQEAV